MRIRTPITDGDTWGTVVYLVPTLGEHPAIDIVETVERKFVHLPVEASLVRDTSQLLAMKEFLTARHLARLASENSWLEMGEMDFPTAKLHALRPDLDGLAHELSRARRA